MKSIVKSVFMVLFVSGAVHAQSLDELPAKVAQLSKAMVRNCTKAGGKARYEPLELV